MSTPHLFGGPPGSTPVEDDHRPFLINSAINTRGELNDAEQANIFKATYWLANNRMSTSQLLNPQLLQTIHKRMFGEVWTWAGKIRLRETTVGVAPWQIQVQLKDLCDDVVAMLSDTSESKLSVPMIAIIFHHRLVLIHPFVNGNGRHTRLVTNKLLSILDEPEFTWARDSLQDEKELRRAYISALQIADSQNDYKELLSFAQSP